MSNQHPTPEPYSATDEARLATLCEGALDWEALATRPERRRCVTCGTPDPDRLCHRCAERLWRAA